jgi:hypothetical protein
MITLGYRRFSPFSRGAWGEGQEFLKYELMLILFAFSVMLLLLRKGNRCLGGGTGRRKGLKKMFDL